MPFHVNSRSARALSAACYYADRDYLAFDVRLPIGPPAEASPEKHIIEHHQPLKAPPREPAFAEVAEEHFFARERRASQAIEAATSAYRHLQLISPSAIDVFL